MVKRRDGPEGFLGAALLILMAAGCGSPAASKDPQLPKPSEPSPSVPVKAPAARLFSFTQDVAGRIPTGFSAVRLPAGQGSGYWRVEENPLAATPPRLLSWTPPMEGPARGLLILAEGGLAHATVCVQLRAADGSSGARAGMLVCYQDLQNHLQVGVDLATGDCSLTRQAQGRSEVLAQGKVQPPHAGWIQLQVECSEGSVRCLAGGTPVFSAREKALTAAGGRVGLWAGSGAVLFDELSIQPQ